MKKILMIVAVMALIASTSFAQTYGVKAGVNLSKLPGDTFDDMGSRTSLVFGGFAKFEFSEQFAFQPELLYSTQGAKEKESGATATVRTDYLNLPLMGKYYVADGFSLQAGPQIGFLLSAKAEVDGAGELDGEEDFKDNMKGLDFGFNIGAGYELENGLGFDIRYNIGLSNNADVDDTEVKNGVFQITLGYAF